MFVSNNLVFNCVLAVCDFPFEIGDRWALTRLSKFIRKGGVVFQIGDDIGAGTSVKFDRDGRAVNVNNGPPVLAYYTKSSIYWCIARWQGRRIVIELEKGPTAIDGETIEEWRERWFEFYLAKYNMILGSPENLKPRHIQVDLVADAASHI
jgi:hypothetical protein